MVTKWDLEGDLLDFEGDLDLEDDFPNGYLHNLENDLLDGDLLNLEGDSLSIKVCLLDLNGDKYDVLTM